MTWVRNFGQITLIDDEGGLQLKVEGHSLPGDTTENSRVKQLHVAVVALPDGEQVLWKPAPIPLNDPWSAIFEDPPPPFNRRGQAVLVMGVALVTDEEEQFVWQDRLLIGPPLDEDCD
jgi:hypothetical protein